MIYTVEVLIVVLTVINFFALLFLGCSYICDTAVDKEIAISPIWRMVWNYNIPLNLAGKIIVCGLLAILFLPADICVLVFTIFFRVLGHICYAFWWIFAINRVDVACKWKCFWKGKDVYVGCWKKDNNYNERLF